MFESIPHDFWRVPADDPLALTKIWICPVWSSPDWSGFGNFEHFALQLLMECDGTARPQYLSMSHSYYKVCYHAGNKFVQKGYGEPVSNGQFGMELSD